MKYIPKKVYERVYIYAAKIQIKEGWILVIYAMDAYSRFVFKPGVSDNTKITITVLNELFDNILEEYNPLVHPKQICFVTNLPEEYLGLFLQTKAANHRFEVGKIATANAMRGFLNTLQFKLVKFK